MDLLHILAASNFKELAFEWYPVFGVIFMACLMLIFLTLLRSTVSKTKPETVKASKTEPVLWEEVQGVDAAKDELIDVTAWLKEPDRFAALGAEAPRGVLLYGPPGTGKTMLARAVAAQAGVDFFSASGSSFVEMFVGRGAARIRRLFKDARKAGRAVIFIDELDAIGGARSGGGGDGGTSEREQALNQLLVELDGFERSKGTVIVIAASNHVDKLDHALLRPGRFDRQVLVSPPDRDGREAILRAHAKGKPLGPDLDLRDVARKTTGMTGAQLANALNEGAIIAGRAERRAMSREDLDEALLRQSVGSQQARRLNTEERRIIAYHEAGHALCHHLVGGDPPEILSIIPRGRALGFVASSPEEDSYLESKQELKDEIVMLLGGRAAEEEVFGTSFSGAVSDLARVHAVCKQMVGEFGMGVALDAEGVPPIALPTGDYALSDRTRRDVDVAAMMLARDAHRRARTLLSANRKCLDDLARVHAVCKQMVGEFGMGVALDAEGVPPIALPTGDYALSDRTRRDVDVAAMMLARDAHRRARALLAANRECLDDLAAAALERETLSREEMENIFAAHELGRREGSEGIGEKAAVTLMPEARPDAGR